MDPLTCEFLAENQSIKIVPNFSELGMSLICHDIGPFEAGAPTTVPVWVALHLKKRKKCSIIPPDWLTVDEVKKFIAAESDQSKFSPIPECFFEISNLLLVNAKDDVEHYDQLKSLVKDLWDKREAKMRTSTIKFLGQYAMAYAELDNLTQLEICCARKALTHGTKQLDKLNSTLHFIKD